MTLALEASLTVAWDEPENPGPPITGYDVQYREGTSGFFINAPHEGTGRTATLTGLEAATLYQVQVRARNEEGTGRWSEPGEGLTLAGPTAVLPFSVPDRGGFSVTSQDAEPMLRVGYGQVETDAGMTPPAGLAIFSSRVNGILVSEAGVPASAAVLEGRIFAETDGPVRTGLAMANPNDAARATIEFFFTNSDGIDSGHGTFTLGPREQIVRFLDEAPFNGGSEMLGTFTFTSNLPVAVIALRGFVNERSEFLMTTLPVAPIAVPTTGTVYFPLFADGGGWTTQVVLVNPTYALISGNVQFISSGSETEAAAPSDSNACRWEERIDLLLCDPSTQCDAPPYFQSRGSPRGRVGSRGARPRPARAVGRQYLRVPERRHDRVRSRCPGIHLRRCLPRVRRGQRHTRPAPRGVERHRPDQHVGCAHDGLARIDGPGRDRDRTPRVTHHSRIGPHRSIH